MSSMVICEFRNASSRRRSAIISNLNSTVCVKISGSGLKVINVPCKSVFPVTSNWVLVMPRSKVISCFLPPLQTSALNRVDKAFTQLTPTPWSPPETLYESLSNFPPACSLVSTTSMAGMPILGWISTGIPRPLSETDNDPSSWMVTTMWSQCPARDSSIELSTTSLIRWCNPLGPTSPMYIAGRFRTASRPSSTWILDAWYSELDVLLMRVQVSLFLEY